MALISKANFITQIDAAAAALTTAFSDTVKTEFALPLSDPRHPLRKVRGLFVVDPATGVYTTNTAYIDAVYDNGAYPTMTTNIDTIGDIAPVFSTATVEAAAPANIVLTFDNNITSVEGVSIGGNSDPAKSIIGVIMAGDVVTITVDTDYVALATITVSGSFFNGLDQVILTDEAVTNNVS